MSYNKELQLGLTATTTDSCIFIVNFVIQNLWTGRSGPFFLLLGLIVSCISSLLVLPDWFRASWELQTHERTALSDASLTQQIETRRDESCLRGSLSGNRFVVQMASWRGEVEEAALTSLVALAAIAQCCTCSSLTADFTRDSTRAAHTPRYSSIQWYFISSNKHYFIRPLDDIVGRS